MRERVLITFLLLLLPVPSLFADTVELKSGEIIEGRITAQNKNTIRMQVGEHKRNDAFLIDQIEKINGKTLKEISEKRRPAVKKLFGLFGKAVKMRKDEPKQDVIYLKSGQVIKGEIVSENKYVTNIKSEKSGYVSSFLKEQIRETRKDVPLTELSENKKEKEDGTAPVKEQASGPVPAKVPPPSAPFPTVRQGAYVFPDRYDKFEPLLSDQEKEKFKDMFSSATEEEEPPFEEVLFTEEKSFSNFLGRDNPSIDFDLGYEVSSLHYEQPDIMKQDGFMQGLFASFTYRRSTDKDVNTLKEVWEDEENFNVAKIEGKTSGGSLDYDSVDTGQMDDIPTDMFEVRGLLGYDYAMKKSLRLMPYSGFGYRYFNDDMEGRTTTNNWRYERESYYYYIPLGLETSWKVKPKWSLRFILEYDYLLDGTQKSHLEDGGVTVVSLTTGNTYVLDMLENDQDEGWGVRGSVRLMRASRHCDFFLEPFFRFWDIKESDPAQWTSEGGTLLWFNDVGLTQPSTQTEPDNYSLEWGVKAGVHF